MLTDGEGRKLSKRDAAMDLGQLRREHSPEEIIGLLAFRSGLIDREEALSPRGLLGEFRWEKLKKDDIAII
jgi:glutamyl-tRNA synthetase